MEKAKQDSIETLLAAADTGAKVVAAGCMAERYGRELADSLPEAQAVLGFDDYPDIAARLGAVLAGEKADAHTPRDRRELLPLTPVDRRGRRCRCPATAPPPATWADAHTPAHLRPVLRRRLDAGPVASLKLACGCDRRCAFCAIPSFRGAFVSRPPDELLAEAEWLADQACGSWCWSARTPPRTARIWATRGRWRSCCRSSPRSTASSGCGPATSSPPRPGPAWWRRSPPRPAWRPTSTCRSSTPASRCCGGCAGSAPPTGSSSCSSGPRAGPGGRRAVSNVIVGFPGETERDVAELDRFLTGARLDAIGVFGYSDEDGTEAAGLPGKLAADAIDRRVDRIAALADELCAQRAEERLGSTVEVLVERSTTAWSRAGPRTRPPRSTARPPWSHRSAAAST